MTLLIRNSTLNIFNITNIELYLELNVRLSVECRKVVVIERRTHLVPSSEVSQYRSNRIYLCDLVVERVTSVLSHVRERSGLSGAHTP